MFYIADVGGGDLTLTRFTAPDETNADALAALTAVGGPLHGAVVGLTTDPAGVTPGSAYADIDQPTFAGYTASAAVTWGTPVLLPSGVTVSFGAPVYFVCTGTPSPAQTVYGWFVYIPAVVGPPAVAAILRGGALFLGSTGLPAPVIVNGPMSIPVWPAFGLGRAA